MPPTPLGVGLLQALVFRMLRNENCNLLPSLKRDGFHFGHNNENQKDKVTPLIIHKALGF